MSISWRRVGDNSNVYNQLQRIDVAAGNTGATGEDDTVHIPAEMNAHVHVFEGDTTLSSNTTLGSSTLEEITMARFEGDLTIDSGATLDINDRGWGLCLLVEGDLTIADGSISMNQSGYGIDPNAVGYPVAVLPDAENRGTDAILPLIGGDRTVLQLLGSGSSAGIDGNNGASGCCGGGGTGSVRFDSQTHSGLSVGSVGTLFCGGSGGGGIYDDDGNSPATRTSAATNFGKAGGDAINQSIQEVGGGSGNPGGSGTSEGDAGVTGCGGLVIAIVTGNIDIQSSGSIEADGGDGGDGQGSDTNAGGGGGSGGGAINLYHGGTFTNNGSLSVSGGVGGSSSPNGGDGGDGSTTTTSVTL